MTGRLQGKVAIVTGAASGFGAGIAEKFVAEGAQVLIADRNGEGALDLAARLGAHGKARVLTQFTWDRKYELVRRVYERLAARHSLAGLTVSDL